MRSPDRIKARSGFRAIPHRKSSSFGFTLAETLVAVFILAVVLAMTARMMVKSFRLSEHAQDLTVSTLVARQAVDQMTSIPFGELITKPYWREWQRVDQGSKTYRWKADVTDVEGHAEDLAWIKVEVSWKHRGEDREKEYDYVRSK